MNKAALELYLYMGSSQPIIDWLKSEGVKTKNEAKDKLFPLVQSNVYNVASHIGRGNNNVSLAGTANSVNNIIEYFPEN
jgi:predicted flavoprotein YhiN